MAPGSGHSSFGYSVLSEVALEDPFCSLPWMVELAAEGQGRGKDFLTVEVYCNRGSVLLGALTQGPGYCLDYLHGTLAM